MKKIDSYVVFNIDDQRFALPLHCVERVVRMVDIQALSKAPEYILGVINFHGDIIPVVNFRELFKIPQRDVELSDQLVVAKSESQKVAIWVDSVTDLIEGSDEDIIKQDKFYIKDNYVKGLLKLDDGVILIHDLDSFMNSDEIQLLKEVLTELKKKDSKQIRDVKLKK